MIPFINLHSTFSFQISRLAESTSVTICSCKLKNNHKPSMLFESTFLWTMWFSHLSTQGHHITGNVFTDHMIKEETNITEGRESGDASDCKAMDHRLWSLSAWVQIPSVCVWFWLATSPFSSSSSQQWGLHYQSPWVVLKVMGVTTCEIAWSHSIKHSTHFIRIHCQRPSHH